MPLRKPSTWLMQNQGGCQPLRNGDACKLCGCLLSWTFSRKKISSGAEAEESPSSYKKGDTDSGLEEYFLEYSWKILPTLQKCSLPKWESRRTVQQSCQNPLKYKHMFTDAIRNTRLDKQKSVCIDNSSIFSWMPKLKDTEERKCLRQGCFKISIIFKKLKMTKKGNSSRSACRRKSYLLEGNSHCWEDDDETSRKEFGPTIGGKLQDTSLVQLGKI